MPLIIVHKSLQRANFGPGKNPSQLAGKISQRPAKIMIMPTIIFTRAEAVLIAIFYSGAGLYNLLKGIAVGG